MSRGPGKIEKAVEAAFRENPDHAYTVEDLADHVFFGINRIEKKHRVSLIRATKKVCSRLDWSWFISGGKGGTLVFFNPYSVMSYGMGSIKAADISNHYRSKDPRIPDHWRTDEADVLARLQPGGRDHGKIIEGGTWWKFVKMNVIERDKDASPEARQLYEDHNAMRVAYGFPPWPMPAHFNA